MSRRRRYLIVLLLAFIAGYVKLAFDRNAVVQSQPAQKQPLPLSESMRPVYKISQESALESEDVRLKLLDSNLELAQLAALAATDPTDAESRNKLADAYFRAGLDWSAYHLFHEVETLTGGDFHAELGLARVWDKWQDYSMARTQVLDALAKNAKSAEAYELMGMIYLHGNASRDAIAAFQQALDLAPETPALLANLGYAYMLNGMLPEAQARIERALSQDPSLSEARNNLGIVLARTGNYEGALAQMQQVAAPQVALNNLGAVLLSQRKPAEAAQVFQQALRYAPNYTKAQENLLAARALLPPPTIVNLPAFGEAENRKAAIVAFEPTQPAKVEAASTERMPNPVEHTLPAPSPAPAPNLVASDVQMTHKEDKNGDTVLNARNLVVPDVQMTPPSQSIKRLQSVEMPVQPPRMFQPAPEPTSIVRTSNVAPVKYVEQRPEVKKPVAPGLAQKVERQPAPAQASIRPTQAAEVRQTPISKAADVNNLAGAAPLNGGAMPAATGYKTLQYGLLGFFTLILITLVVARRMASRHAPKLTVVERLSRVS